MPIRSIYSWIMQIVPGIKKLPNVSLPMRMALMAFLFLLVIYAAAIVSYRYGGGAQEALIRFIIALPLVFVIPVIIFYLIFV